MRVLGLDVGDRRVGIAVSDPSGMIAHADSMVERTGDDSDLARIGALVLALGVELVVSGLPSNARGEVGRQARKVLTYLDALKDHVNVPIETIDERFSTVAAERTLREAGLDGRKRRRVVDQVAAGWILQTWLDRAAAERRR